MHVASPPAATGLQAGYSAISASLTAVKIQVSVIQHTGDEMSGMARWAISYLAQSTRLKMEEKQMLASLIASIDQFAGGDPKLILDVIAIAKIMESNRVMGEYRAQPFADIEEMYWEARERMGGERPGITRTTIEMQITELKLQYSSTQIAVEGVEPATDNTDGNSDTSTNLMV